MAVVIVIILLFVIATSVIIMAKSTNTKDLKALLLNWLYLVFHDVTDINSSNAEDFKMPLGKREKKKKKKWSWGN